MVGTQHRVWPSCGHYPSINHDRHSDPSWAPTAPAVSNNRSVRSQRSLCFSWEFSQIQSPSPAVRLFRWGNPHSLWPTHLWLCCCCSFATRMGVLSVVFEDISKFRRSACHHVCAVSTVLETCSQNECLCVTEVCMCTRRSRKWSVLISLVARKWVNFPIPKTGSIINWLWTTFRVENFVSNFCPSNKWDMVSSFHMQVHWLKRKSNLAIGLCCCVFKNAVVIVSRGHRRSLPIFTTISRSLSRCCRSQPFRKDN